MKHAARLLTLSTLVGAASLFASCSGNGGNRGMYVQSCTLGCTNGKGGLQVSCGIINTYQNQDLAVVFSDAVDLGSLQAQNAFQVVDVVTGSSPAGSRLVDVTNSRRALFRPKLSFDNSGNPSYGFVDGKTYEIRIPGTAQGDLGPYVESRGGQSNTSRMLCTITTDQGVIDPVPGGPQVSIYVMAQGHPNPIDLDAAGNVTNVLTFSPITFVFNDLMNIGTVVQPSTGQAPFIKVEVDADGNPASTTDRVAVGGSYTFNINQTNLTTTAVFVPSAGYPSAGTGPLPRLIVVTVKRGSGPVPALG